jgi:hypothetical protein
MKCNVTTEKVEVTTVKSVKRYNLTLNEREAAFIKALVGNIAGKGDIRKITSSIYEDVNLDVLGIFNKDLDVSDFDEQKLSQFSNE